MLLERESDLRALDEAMAAAASGTGRPVVIEGEAGIGKSTLLRAALSRAEKVGLRSIQATGSELERQYPYGIAIALFEPTIRVRSSSTADPFPGPEAQVAALFGSGAEPGPGSGDPFAMVHGLYWLALDASDRGPLLMAVDDAQWADDGSLRFLHYLAQRVRELPIMLLLAFRSGEGASDEMLGRVLRSDRTALHIQPEPLSEGAVGELLASSHGPEIDPTMRRACWDATHGNPFLVTELIRELEHRRPVDRSGHQGVIEGIVPARVTRFVEERVARMEPSAQRVAEAVAILDDAAILRRVAVLARMSEDEALDASRGLTRAAILDAGATLRFVHPLVRTAVYDTIPAVARARAHRDAVRILLDEGALPGILSGQLLEAECSGDPRVVEAIIEAGRDATARGEPQAAVRMLRRALEEPPTSDQRQPLLVALARAEADSGDAPAAAALFEEALALTSDRRDRAALLLELGHALVRSADHARGTDMFMRGLSELDDPEDPLHARLESGVVAAGWMAGSGHEVAHRITARILSDTTFGAAHRELVMSIAFQRSMDGSASAAEMIDLVRRVLAEAPIEVLIGEGQVVELSNGVLFSTDELDLQVDLLTRAIDAAQDAHVHSKIGLYSVARSWAHYFSGRLLETIADTDAGIRAAEVGWETFYPVAIGVQAMAHVERADLAAAEKILDVDSEPWSKRADWLVPLIARGRLMDALGDSGRALAAWREAATLGSRMGYRNPGPPEWRTWLAVALARHGDREEARRIAHEGLEIARRWGARWPLAAALRAVGIVEGGAEGIDRLREAAAILETSPARLERARVLADLGAALRRRGRSVEARDVLTESMDLAHQLGARSLLARSRDEARTAGARPRRYALRGIEALTPAETRVVRLAAAGRTNREIAEALFVTPKAVEFHLGNAYVKLGVGSRRELPATLEVEVP